MKKVLLSVFPILLLLSACVDKSNRELENDHEIQNQKMKKEIIQTQDAPQAIGPYSQAVRVGKHLVYCSGQIAIDPSAPESWIRQILKVKQNG